MPAKGKEAELEDGGERVEDGQDASKVSAMETFPPGPISDEKGAQLGPGGQRPRKPTSSKRPKCVPEQRATSHTVWRVHVKAKVPETFIAGRKVRQVADVDDGRANDLAQRAAGRSTRKMRT